MERCLFALLQPVPATNDGAVFEMVANALVTKRGQVPPCPRFPLGSSTSAIGHFCQCVLFQRRADILRYTHAQKREISGYFSGIRNHGYAKRCGGAHFPSYE
jgi:hypothetical protein